MNSHARVVIRALVAFVALAACSSSTTPDRPDGATSLDAVDSPDVARSLDGGAADAFGPGTDVVVVARDAAHTTGLYAPCASDADCAAAPMASCDQRYPGGFCTRMCASNADCGGDGLCLGGSCHLRCTVGGGQCEVTQVCNRIDPRDPVAGACFPACYATDPPPGVPRCAPGLVCDPYAQGGASCVVAPATHGALNGEPCTTDGDCAGFCIREVAMDGSPSGWVGGSCASLGRLPDRSEYQPGRPLPQSTCPDGSVAMPANGIIAGGEMAVCLRACVTDADCARPARRCNRDVFGIGLPPTNGFCAPIDCQNGPYAAMPNRGCPAGYACQPNPMMPAIGVCARTP